MIFFGAKEGENSPVERKLMGLIKKGSYNIWRIVSRRENEKSFWWERKKGAEKEEGPIRVS